MIFTITHNQKVVNDVFEYYLLIKQDLLSNLKDVFLRPHYWARKYRGNIDTEINIGVSEIDYNIHRVQIFVRHGGVWIRDVMLYDRKGLKESEIKTNMYE